MNTQSLAKVGAFGREIGELTLSITGLTTAGLRSVPVIFSKTKGPVFWILFMRNLRQIGVQSAPFVGFIAALIGFFVIGRAFIFAPSVANYSDYYAEFFVIVVMREMGPFICGILLITRSGVAITAEIGFLKLNNEFETLKSIGVDPKHLFLLPVFFAFPLSLLLMFVVFLGVCMLVSNIAITVYGYAFITMSDYLSLILSKVDLLEILIMGLKALIGGVIIGLISLHFGTAVGSRFTDISRALKRATSYQIVVYLLLNVCLSAVGYL